MTAQFPTNIVSTSNIPDANPLTSLSANNHAGKHNDLRDEIIAIETKVGVTNSVVNTTLDYKTKNITGGDQAIGATQTVNVSNKTLVSPKVTVGSDAIGDMLYNSSGATGVQSRIPVGSSGQVLTSNGTNPFWTSPSSTNTSYAVDTGAANAYVVTLSPALGAYTAGVLVQFKASNANTTVSTVNVNGLGVKTIKKLGGATDLVSGDIASGMIVELEYDGTNFLMLNPVANAPVTAVTDIQTFTTAGATTWTKPANAKYVEVTVIGGGGGGGVGNSNAAGGAGGGYGYKKFLASALGSTENLTVGAGGAASTSGGTTTFGTTTLLRATGGQGANQTGATTGGTANGDINFQGGAGGAGNNAAGPVDSTTNPAPRGGGAGGYNAGTPATATAGQNGGAFTTNYVRAGASGGAAGVNNGSSASAAAVGLFFGGVGGGGGGFNGTGTNTGGNGGAGNLGSGGGGATPNSGASGGVGGDGAVVVISYF